ncbi:MAG: CRISPR-associated endonuclease Cas4/Cas1, partial [Planctomycetes bacterium]|nr:CRISPR-associated endonuclease Cas4/Cas1 [Planctomycetota bacterium]
MAHPRLPDKAHPEKDSNLSAQAEMLARSAAQNSEPRPSSTPSRADVPISSPRRAHSKAAPPDYLPARMLNEFVYCPRLFYYEWVEGVFEHNTETIEGSLRHRKLDAKQDELPSAEELEAAGA